MIHTTDKMKVATIKNVRSAFDLMPDRKEELLVLAERSARLAERAIVKVDLSDEVGFICFRFGRKEYYGISYQVAKEVIPLTSLTKIPNTPDMIAGVINWRGSLLTILDLRCFFKLPKNPNKNSFIIIIESHSMVVGILADNIQGNDTYNLSKLEPALPEGVSIKSKYIHGLHKGLIAIINIDAVMSAVKAQFDK